MNRTAAPPAKRARTAHRGEDDYRPGSIVEIEVDNFMTYSHIKSQPGPRLNLVIGPNGTGKSSLVCAIGIGLAGEPQLLGRASQIGDFVKRGEESGWIKISLRGDSPTEVLVIKRKINKRNKSEWSFNDQTVTKKDIQEKVRKYNIQLDNLTQFLPQDRVCEFAKLTPIQLLEETEKAVGNPELSSKHQTLIQKNEELKKIRTTLSSHEDQLKHVKASNAELEEDKQRMHQRAQLLDKAEMMKKKIPWLKYDDKKVSYQGAKETESQANSRLQTLKERNREIKSAFEPFRLKKDKAKEASDRLHTKKTQNEQKLRGVADNETELSAKVRSKFTEIQDVHKKEALRQERIERGRKEVGDAEADLERIPQIKPQPEILNNIKAQIEELHMQELQKKSQMQEMESQLSKRRYDHDQCNRRLRDINTVNTRLLQTLRNHGARQIIEAYEWVQSNRSQFKCDVFGPVLLEVRIANTEHAKYVENLVANHIWKAFITQDAEDRDLLVRNLKQFEVPVINQRSGQDRRPPMVTSAVHTKELVILNESMLGFAALTMTPKSVYEMMQLGITARLDEVIEAPAVVKTLLIGQANLDKAFIGTSETNRRADEAFDLGVNDLWTPENHYRWSKSRYGSNNVSTSVNAVRAVRLFSENVDLREKTELENRKAQLEEEIIQFESELKESSAQCKLVQEEIQKLNGQGERIYNEARSQKKKLLEARNTLEQRRRRLLMLENEEGSVDAESRLRAAIKQINVERVRNLMILKELLTEAGEAHITYAAHHLHAIELDAMVKEMEKEVRKSNLEVDEATETWHQCHQATEHCRNQLVLAKEIAEDSARLTTDLQKKFAEMPDSIEELNDEIADCKGQAAAVICNNENALLIYEQRCEEIRNLSMKAEDKRAALNMCLKDIETIQGSWLPELRELVSNINETFSQNFMEMAVAGEVSLDEHGTDFDQYGILIKVKFRESGSLQVLSAHHQSGGERSVSTILYLVSLQDLTYCPFRVVDEINQGMDPKNERKMFQQLVRAASQPNTPQCLLLTPKLLPDLEYTEACTILNIMNGPWIDDASSSGWKDGISWSAMSQLIPTQ